MSDTAWLDVDGAKLGVSEVTPGAGEGCLVVGPVWLDVADRLVAGSDGANLGELWLEQVDQQADDQKGGDDEKPDGFNVALVVTEVVSKHEQNGNPASELDGVALETVPSPCSRRLIKGGYTAVDLRLNRVGGTSHVLLLYSQVAVVRLRARCNKHLQNLV